MQNSHSKSRSKDKIRILTDEFEADPADEFTNYSKIILSMIKGSVPDFSIGLYGEWGTGKTTLMKLIYNNLADEYKVEDGYYLIIPVWFNAWMYEIEHQFALFPLLLTIAKAISDKHGEDQMTLKNNLKRFVRGFRIGVTKSLPEVLSLIPFFDKEIAKKPWKTKIYLTRKSGSILFR